MARSRVRSADGLTNDLARRTATYSKKLSVPPGAEQPAQLGEYLFDALDSKIIQRQTRDNQFKRLFLGKFFHGCV